MVNMLPLLAFREARWCPVLAVPISAVLTAAVCGVTCHDIPTVQLHVTSVTW